MIDVDCNMKNRKSNEVDDAQDKFILDRKLVMKLQNGGAQNIVYVHLMFIN